MDLKKLAYGGADAGVRGYVSWALSHPWTMLLASLGLTVIFAYWGFQIPLRTNLEDLFPETTPHVVRAKETRDRMASSSQVLLVTVSPDREANIRFLGDLQGRLSQSPLVSSFEFRREIGFFKRNAVLFVSQEELKKLDRRVQKAIRKAVEKDLDPFAEEGGKQAAKGGKAEQDDLEGEGFASDRAKKAAADDDVEDEGFASDRAKKEAAAVEPEESEEGEAGEEEASLEVPTEKEIKEKYGVSTLSEYDESADGTVVALRIFPSFAPADVKQSRMLLKQIGEAIAELNPASYHLELTWAMEGDYHKKIEEIDVLYRDLLTSTFSALALIFLMMMVFFRRVRVVLLAFIPLTAGLAWAVGFAYATMGYLNLVTAFIFGVLSGLGVEYSMHVAERYCEERERGRKPAAAALETLAVLGRAMFGSAVMTACGFLALMIFEFRGFSQFGLVAGVGIPLCLLVVYLMFPPMVVLFDRLVPEKPYAPRLSIERSASLFATRRMAVVVVCGVLAMAAVLLPGLRFVDFESNMKKVMTPSAESKRDKVMRQYKDKVGRKSASPIALLTDSQEETLAVQRYLDEHKGEYRTLESVASIFSFVPEDQQAKMPQVQKIRERIERKLGVLKGKDLEDAHRALEYLHPEPFTVDDLPEWVKDKFTDRQGRVGTFLVLTARGNKADAHEVGTITKELDDITVDGRTYHTSASYFILKDVYDIVRKEGPLALLLAALAALLMVIIDFGRVFEVTVAFLPLLLGIACFVGFMGLAGENFTMFNMIILPSVFGTSIDTSTHILHRIREEGAARIGQIANTTGAATFLGAMTNTIGFGSLIVATNPGLANIGQLAPIGLLICWLVCLTLTCAFGRLRGRQ